VAAGQPPPPPLLLLWHRLWRTDRPNLLLLQYFHLQELQLQRLPCRAILPLRWTRCQAQHCWALPGCGCWAQRFRCLLLPHLLLLLLTHGWTSCMTWAVAHSAS
jgi:hypothetical protein